MSDQLWPVYLLGGACAIYTLKGIISFLLYESAPEPYETLDDKITDIVPQETPFMRAMKEKHDKRDHRRTRAL